MDIKKICKRRIFVSFCYAVVALQASLLFFIVFIKRQEDYCTLCGKGQTRFILEPPGWTLCAWERQDLFTDIIDITNLIEVPPHQHQYANAGYCYRLQGVHGHRINARLHNFNFFKDMLAINKKLGTRMIHVTMADSNLCDKEFSHVLHYALGDNAKRRQGIFHMTIEPEYAKGNISQETYDIICEQNRLDIESSKQKDKK